MRTPLVVSMMVGLGLHSIAAAQPVSWSDADAHVGDIVSIEGFVREVRREGRRLTLLFDTDDPRALRVTLLIPLVTDLPPEPELLYRERRVQVRGRVTRTAGHLDLIVTDPDRILIAGLTSDAPPPPDATGADTGRDEPTPTMAPASPATPPQRPAPQAAAAQRAVEACTRLEASLEAARLAALDAVAALRRCLEDARSGCAAETDAIARPVTRFEWIEQERRVRCADQPPP